MSDEEDVEDLMSWFERDEQDLCVGCGAADDEPHDEDCPFDEFEGF